MSERRPTDQTPSRLSRREHQIMQILYDHGESGVAEVLKYLPDPPGYSAVRALLRILEEKGHVRHIEVDKRYVYRPAETLAAVAKANLEEVVKNYFAGSIEDAVATLLSGRDSPDYDELDRLEALIRQARKSKK